MSNHTHDEVCLVLQKLYRAYVASDENEADSPQERSQVLSVCQALQSKEQS